MARKPKKHAHSRARENALAILYSSDIIETDATSIIEEGRYPDGDIHVSDYAESLVEGVTQHLGEIDERLVKSSDNWALDRMPVVDRAILRLAVYEMLYVDEVPVSVAINEAVELAKVYGGEDESSRFVNGVLGRIARAEEGDANDAESKPSKDEGVEGSVDANDAEEAAVDDGQADKPETAPEAAVAEPEEGIATDLEAEVNDD